MKKILLLLLLVFATPIVLATPQAPSNLQVLGSSSRILPQTSQNSIDAQGGNVTVVNIDALTITKTWQGYYGNVTGNIRLEDANNQTFYTWGNATSLNGQIYATRNSSPEWGTVNCSTAAQRSAEETYLGVSPIDGDSLLNTYNTTYHPGFYVGMQQIYPDQCYSTNVFVNGTIQNSSFYQMLLSDEANNTLYSTIIQYQTHGFNGQVVDFQLLVGENEHIGSEGPTTYYFFVELN